MKTAERIVEALLESDEVDPKHFALSRSDQMFDRWEQVDGDMDWWEHGGTFHNDELGQLIHIPGLDGEDYSSWDIELTPEDEAEILAQFPVQIDPEWPEGGDENEQNREDAIEKLKDERAEQKNAARTQSCERWTDDYIEDYADSLPDVLHQMNDMDLEEFKEMPLGAQWSAIGQILGYSQFDDMPEPYTWAELDKYLTPRTDFRGKSRQQHHLPETL